MRSMSNSLASRLVTTGRAMFAPDGQFDAVGLGPFSIQPGGDLSGDLEVVTAACEPGPRKAIAHEVAKLMVRTKARVQGEGEAKLLAETMVDDLSRYPLDVVRFACAYWIEGGREARFFPSWPELKSICDRRMDGRLRLRRALEWAVTEGSDA